MSKCTVTDSMEKSEVKKVHDFLIKVDKLFPTPLSQKQELALLAEKFCKYGLICAQYDQDKNISAMLAGYIKNTPDNIGYMSVLAVLPSEQGKGISSKLIREFLAKAKEEGLDSVHLYTDKTNIVAKELYKKLGFVPWVLKNEPRPDDLHFIYYLK